MIVGNYQCEDVATARSQIEAFGLVVGLITPTPPASDDTWIVMAQAPAAGDPVAPGSSVDLNVEPPNSACP